MKKAQMEIMGLAIIVILLSLGLLFVIRFVVLKPTEDMKQNYETSELAANFLNALLDTHAPNCHDIKFSALYQDCVNNKAYGGKIQCDTYKSCGFIEEETKIMFENSFDKWGIDYYYIVFTDMDNKLGSTIFQPIGKQCEGNMKPKFQPLPSSPPVYLGLYICE